MLGIPDDMPIEQKMLTGAIETAQKRVEGRNYSIRKNVLEYDDVMNKQRNIIYDQRRQILDSDSIEEIIKNLATNKVYEIVDTYTSNLSKKEEIDKESLNNTIQSIFGFELEDSEIEKETLEGVLLNKVFDAYEAKRNIFKEQGIENEYNVIEKLMMLRNVDEKWQEHMDNMTQLKEGIYLRGYGQTNPVEAYKQESYEIFSDMTHSIKEDTIKTIFRTSYNTSNTKNTVNRLGQSINRIDDASKASINIMNTGNPEVVQKREPVRVEKTVGRNEPCPCGSGKKYKQCCGRNN